MQEVREFTSDKVEGSFVDGSSGDLRKNTSQANSQKGRVKCG